MRFILLFLFSYPLIRADYCWTGSAPETFSWIGNNKHCNFTLIQSNLSTGIRLSLAVKNIGINESVQVSWGNNSISNSQGSTMFSFVQIILYDDITISLNTGSSSQMQGNYLYSYTNDTAIPMTQVNVSYGQEGFTLASYREDMQGKVNLPRMFEITADSKVAIISIAHSLFCTSCTNLAWIYEGTGKNTQFIGTATDFNRNLYISKGKTATLYIVAHGQSVTDNVDYMDVIANEAKNLEKCSTFDVLYCPDEESNPSLLNYTIDATGGGGACLTGYNYCFVPYATQFGNIDFYAYAGIPHPDPVQAGLILADYSQRDISYGFPQYFPGHYVTYYVANGAAMLMFNDTIPDGFIPYNGRYGFLQSPFYPFSTTGSFFITDIKLALSEVDYFYNITITVEKTYEPVGSNANLEIRKKSAVFQKIPFDVKTNVGVPTTFQVAPYTNFEVILHGGSIPNQGSLITWNIGNVPTGNSPTTKNPDSPKIGAENSFIMITVIFIFTFLL